ncbi:MvdC/MvdD family ATP grasp protein [Streptomyces sp. enrichment culture]|uniref:MvdC/MvdD family ATP grasp protein n=1 Tax=Streptomyces sp. enrichment culture TaxID=1795815 RepID=UPI003F54D167
MSNQELDGHVAPVTTELSRRGAEWLVYNPAKFPGNSRIAVETTGTGVRAFLACDDIGFIDLSDVTAVWYRRPGGFELSEVLLDEEREWVRNECTHLIRGLWEGGFLRGWVSDPEAVRKSSVKVSQLGLASAMGFTVPRFTITNDVDKASEFISTCKQGVIVKVLADPGILYPNRAGTIYTHLLTDADMDQIQSVRFGPTYLQEYVPKKMDVRVTVIGRSIFAVGISSQGVHQSRVDFRRAPAYTLPHVPMELPRHVSSLCVQLVMRLGLQFGAIDLVLTPDDEYVFLEINPNGQWYWLEEITGIPLTASMCDLLIAQGRAN